MKVLVIDIGGSHVKMLATGQSDPIRFDSDSHLTPDAFVARVRDLTHDWEYDVVSLGYPGTVGRDGPVRDPGNLGPGWVSYDFAAAFTKAVRVVNDAAMQALGGYDGGRMLFLGLGTGLGSALVTERVVVPLELGNLPYGPDETMSKRLGKQGLERHGKLAWQAAVTKVTCVLRESFMADYVVLGGGNVKQMAHLPPDTRRGGNEDAFKGGFMLWEEWVEPHDAAPSAAWRVVQ